MKFRITRLLDSGVMLPDDLDVEGIHLDAFSAEDELRAKVQGDDPHDVKLVASGESEAEDLKEALTDVEARMLRALDALFICQLVLVSSYGASTLIEKDKERRFCFMFQRRQRSAWPIDTLSAAVKDDIARVSTTLKEESGIQRAARSFRDAAAASNILGRAASLFSSAEALTEGASVGDLPPRRTDHQGLRELLGDDSYDYFYRSGGVFRRGVRNDLAHGRPINQEECARRIDGLVDAIKRMLTERLEVATQPAMRPKGLYDLTVNGRWFDSGQPPEVRRLVAMSRDGSLGLSGNPRELIAGESADAMAAFGIKPLS